MKTKRNGSILTLALAFVATALAIGAITRDANATALGAPAMPGYPSSIAAIGHSNTNGSGVKGPRTNWSTAPG